MRNIYTPLESNPYQPHKTVEAKYTLCETCERNIESKDWPAHQAGKKHQKAKKEKEAKEAAAKKPVQEDKVADWGDQVNDDAAQQEEAGWNDENGFTSTAPSKNKGLNGTCYNCGEPGHMKADCPQPPKGGGGGGSQEW